MQILPFLAKSGRHFDPQVVAVFMKMLAETMAGSDSSPEFLQRGFCPALAGQKKSQLNFFRKTEEGINAKFRRMLVIY